MSRSLTIAGTVLALWMLTAGVACVSSDVDPRCTIHAPTDNYLAKLAQSVNGSKLWQAYFDLMMPVKEGAEPLIAVDLDFERQVTRTTQEGDYDPGVVKITFSVTSLMDGSTLYKEKKEAKLDAFMIGYFDEDATREEIQEIAFEDTEEDVFAFIDRWINIAAIRAMRREGKSAFIPVLEEQAEDPWVEDLSSEAKWALREIQEAQ